MYVRVDGTPFAVPLRSNINHPHALMTDAENGCGLDYSKAVVIAKPEYIAEKKPKIRPNEYDFLRGRDFQVRNGLKKYIKEYKKARLNPHIKRYQMLCAFSTLQYFEKYIRDI